MAEESTTPDLVEMTRVFFETMDRDWDFDSLAGFFASDAVWDLSDSHLGIYEGVGAIGDFLVGYWATWEDHHHEIEAIHDFGHGVLSVAVREDGRLKGSDARVTPASAAFEWAHGEIRRITGYPNEHEARTAAERLAGGLGERRTPRRSCWLALGSYAALSDLNPEVFIRFHVPDCEGRMTPSVAAVFGGDLLDMTAFARSCGTIRTRPSFKIEIREARIATDGILLIKQRLSVTTAVMGVQALDAWRDEVPGWPDHQLHQLRSLRPGGIRPRLSRSWAWRSRRCRRTWTSFARCSLNGERGDSGGSQRG